MSMDDEASSDLQKCMSEEPMDTDEGPLINENSNGLSHLLTESEFNSVDAVAVDESSASNQGFLNAVELSAGSVGDYLENNTDGFNANSFDIGDNAVTFPGDSMNNVLSDGDSRLSDVAFKAASDTDGYTTESQMKNDFEMSETSNEAVASMPEDSIPAKTDEQSTTTIEDSTPAVANEDSSPPIATDDGTPVIINEDSAPAIANEDSSPVIANEDGTSAIVNTDSTTILIDDDSTPALINEDSNPATISEEKTTDTNEVNKKATESLEDSAAGGDIAMEERSETVEETSTKENVGDGDGSAEEKKSADSPKETTEVNQVGDGDDIVEKEKSADSPKETPDVNQISAADGSVEKKKSADSPKDTTEANKVGDGDDDGNVGKEKSADSAMETTEVNQVGGGDGNVEKEKSADSTKEVTEIDQVGGAEETEVVSEDELPLVEKPSVKDAENVSDDELPGPKPADMPDDTEVVSEDELPSSKKELSSSEAGAAKESRKRKPNEEGDGYDPGSPTSETESSTKKQAVTKNGESKPVPAEKRPSTEDKPKKKVLPELDKYWKVVNDEPTDFTGWTYLLQYVDQESEVEAAREAYDAFLSHYPYCYGYWRKYADYEKRKGSKKKCLEVLERGLKAIPLSVDLWIHYLNYIKTTRPEDHTYIRSQFERAIDACGLEFRSDRLWEAYIKWEAENGSALNVTHIYDRLLATPTLGYTSHFDNFQEHVMSEPVAGVVDRAELVRLRAEVRDAAGSQPQLDLPPGEDEPSDHIASEEEAQAIKERIIAARRKVHKTTGEEVAARWTFEEGIKRPYFHVKPLERCQLKNWKLYLEWEKTHGSLQRALVLHERALIACALYDEFWMRLVKFLEERSATNPELVAVEREVLERACTVHHLDKPELHLLWAHFEESHGNAARAAEILDRIEKTCPNVVQIHYRRVNLERRRGDLEKCAQLYEGYIANAKSKAIASALAIKFARFHFHVRHAPDDARKVLNDAIAKDPLNPRLHLQRLDLALHTPDVKYEELEELVSSYEKQEGAELETSAAMAWRRHELAEELGSAAAARAAQAHARTLGKQLRKRARKDRAADRSDPPPLPKSLPKSVESVETDESDEEDAALTTPTNPPQPTKKRRNRRQLKKKRTGVPRNGGSWVGGVRLPSYKRPQKKEGCVVSWRRATSTDLKKKDTSSTTPNTAATTGSTYYQQPPAAAPYEQSYAQPYQPPWGYQQPPGPYQHHPGPWPQYPNYY